MDKVSVTDPLRRVAGATAAALLAQPAVAVKQETKQAQAQAQAEAQAEAQARVAAQHAKVKQALAEYRHLQLQQHGRVKAPPW
jgi:hypothetical protein